MQFNAQYVVAPATVLETRVNRMAAVVFIE
jgi:hypothetical protein